MSYLAITCEAIVAVSILYMFLLCYVVAIKPLLLDAISGLKEAFSKHPRQSAVIIQFARPARRGGRI